nr:MAG TPA: hypothetical protein [Caudoviricetes sp.]
MGLLLSLFLHGAVDNELGALSPTEGRSNRPRAFIKYQNEGWR